MYNNRSNSIHQSVDSMGNHFHRSLMKSTFLPKKSPPKLQLRHAFSNNFGGLSLSQLKRLTYSKIRYSQIFNCNRLSTSNQAILRMRSNRTKLEDKAHQSVCSRQLINRSNKYLNKLQTQKKDLNIKPQVIVIDKPKTRQAQRKQQSPLRDRNHPDVQFSNFIKRRYRKKRNAFRQVPLGIIMQKQKNRFIGPWAPQQQNELVQLPFE